MKTSPPGTDFASTSADDYKSILSGPILRQHRPAILNGPVERGRSGAFTFLIAALALGVEPTAEPLSQVSQMLTHGSRDGLS